MNNTATNSLYKSELPTEPGWYWIKSLASGAESIYHLDLPQTRYWIDSLLSAYLIGPRVSAPEQCAECVQDTRDPGHPRILASYERFHN